jgi:NhaP-type Na+/H+ and K+/H+ antiporter
MRLFIVAVALLLACPLALLGKEETLEEMIQHAHSAELKDQPELYIKIARHELKAADKLYSSSNSDAAREAVNDIVEFSAKAADAAIQSGKRLKNTEIDIRKLAEKLLDIKRTLIFDDQAPVQTAADKLEEMRSRLLNHMFGKNNK